MNMSQSSYKLMRQVSDSFVDGFRRAMRVSSEDVEGAVVPLTQQKLAERSGVGRTTIARYVSMESDDEETVNPDLKTICRLADALNVPPAFLLMRPEDWSHLAQAVMYFSSATQDAKFNALANEITELRSSSPVDVASAGLRLAKKFDVYEEAPKALGLDNAVLKQIESRNRRVRSGILATAALPPLGKLKKGSYPPLLAMCAIVGAANPVNDSENV
jgi:transcriptional regulator with XRE-family HTH domain